MLGRPAKFCLISFVALTLLATGCTFTKIAKERYALPNYSSVSEDSENSIMVALSGPMKGGVLSKTVSIPKTDGGYFMGVHAGGLAALDGHLKILREKFEGRLISTDSGSFTSDSLSRADLKKVLSFYKEASYDAVLLSAKDFNTIQKFHLWDEARGIPFVGANWVNVRTKESALGTGLKPYRIIEREGKRIALIGITLDENDRPDPTLAPEIIREESVAAFLRVLAELRREKIDFRMALVSEGTTCEDSTCVDNQNDHLQSFLKRLPPNSLDLVLAAGENYFQQELSGIPVLQNKAGGASLSLRELEKRENDFVGRELSPVLLCHQFFLATGDCFFEGQFKGKDERTRLIQDSRFESVPAKFLGHEVILNPKWKL